MPQTSFHQPKIMIVAGEPSGDLHASHVVHRVKALCPDVKLFGMGGDLLEKAGVKLDFHIRDSAVMGFADVITVLPMFLRKQAHLKRCIREERPDMLLLVDFAEFNMPLAKYARSQGVSVVYYIPPKAWAWRAGRARKLAKWADVVAAIFPFEAEFYRNAGANTEFVGHPLVDFAQTPLTMHEARAQLGLDESEQTRDAPVIGLVPGSRRSEIRHILPVMLRAAASIAEVYPNAQWILPL
ncbi:lipid-A-disaccharide synthase, partial [Candidatus Poribacteria bacterium]|nr:lipid-A-disaccharide synthase [Candidatus Poribacteria bacterium]